jgi:hypothetical protein
MTYAQEHQYDVDTRGKTRDIACRGYPYHE